MIEQSHENQGEDVSREGVSLEKVLWQPIRLLSLNVYNRAVAKVSDFSMIDLDVVEAQRKELFGENARPIRGVILDVDETMVEHHGDPLDKNIEAVRRMIESGRQVVIFPNMKKSERYEELEAMGGVTVITSKFPKPDVRGFQECCKKMGLDSLEVVMIGDNFMTDGGCINAGIDFIHVDPIETEESVFKALKRLPQTLSRRIFKVLSDGYDVVAERDVLRDEDFA